jgi:hypothetical protein
VRGDRDALQFTEPRDLDEIRRAAHEGGIDLRERGGAMLEAIAPLLEARERLAAGHRDRGRSARHGAGADVGVGQRLLEKADGITLARTRDELRGGPVPDVISFAERIHVRIEMEHERIGKALAEKLDLAHLDIARFPRRARGDDRVTRSIRPRAKLHRGEADLEILGDFAFELGAIVRRGGAGGVARERFVAASAEQFIHGHAEPLAFEIEQRALDPAEHDRAEPDVRQDAPRRHHAPAEHNHIER